MNRVDLVKEVKGINSYTNVIDSSFTELVTPTQPSVTPTPTVEEFFNLYEQLFFDIPISGEFNSHQYLIAKSTDYLGGTGVDAEKLALIEEINSLRQQLLDVSETLLTTDKLTK